MKLTLTNDDGEVLQIWDKIEDLNGEIGVMSPMAKIDLCDDISGEVVKSLKSGT